MLYPGARTPSSGRREIGIGDVMSGTKREERWFGFTLVRASLSFGVRQNAARR
jgi:hypothetical protein